MRPRAVEEHVAVAINHHSHGIHLKEPVELGGDDGEIIHNWSKVEGHHQNMLDDVPQVPKEHIKRCGKVHNT